MNRRKSTLRFNFINGKVSSYDFSIEFKKTFTLNKKKETISLLRKSRIKDYYIVSA